MVTDTDSALREADLLESDATAKLYVVPLPDWIGRARSALQVLAVAVRGARQGAARVAVIERLCLDAADALWAVSKGKKPAVDPRAIANAIYAQYGQPPLRDYPSKAPGRTTFSAWIQHGDNDFYLNEHYRPPAPATRAATTPGSTLE